MKMRYRLIFAVTFAAVIMIATAAVASPVLTEKWLNGNAYNLDVFEREYSLPKQAVWQRVVDTFTPFGYSVGIFDTAENVLCMEKYETYQELIRYVVQFAEYNGKTRIRIFKYTGATQRPINSKSYRILQNLR